MRHEHLVVTVEAGVKERIDADLDAGESLEAWVADAIEQKLAHEAEDDDGPGPDDSDFAGSGPAGSDSGTTDSEYADITDLGEEGPDSSRATDSADDSGSSTIESGGETDAGGEYDEGFEYVDDCAI